MPQGKKPLFSNDFLDELAEEISDLYGGPDQKQRDKEDALDLEERQKNCRNSNSFFIS
ncbi:hypothetical protein [Bacillus benzoevorans]|uniref:Bacitracin ABC transporter ATP-binding protein n=1 Tax=Bacillus benzoevorans TaxID=1456 RepID=A0A7X0LTL7_9BACI|nr:hypothetical protein [Bacillus benzoevorans]MBB6443623.1 hypothetical protein [Bacillus benzoevorans]